MRGVIHLLMDPTQCKSSFPFLSGWPPPTNNLTKKKKKKGVFDPKKHTYPTITRLKFQTRMTFIHAGFVTMVPTKECGEKALGTYGG
jgi:hypothetical protein